MIHLLMAHPGAHVNKDTLGALPLFFCRVLRMPWQKQAAPEVPSTPSGAATATLIADRFPCCEHCTLEDLSQCDPPDSHLTPCSDGCNADAGDGSFWDDKAVLGDQMISDVRAQWNAWHDGLSDTEIAALAPRRVLPREDGDVIIDQRERVHLRPWDYPWPRAEKPVWVQPPEPHRADDTRVDLRIARPYAPQPVYEQAPAADVTEAGRLARVTLP